MEKKSREDIFAENLIKQAGLEKPSAAFSLNVLQAIAAKKAVPAYKPLISARVWLLLGALYICAITGFYFFHTGATLTFGYNIPEIKFPKIEVSGSMTYAIALLSLFLLQIPFLKGIMEKQINY